MTYEKAERRLQQELRARIEAKAENLRDQFAMAALTGLLAGDPDDMRSSHESARVAYVMADAMMQAREQHRGGE